MPLIFRGFRRRCRGLAVLMAAFAVLAVLAPCALAQQANLPTPTTGTLPSTVMLRDGVDDYTLSPDAYITGDAAGNVVYADLIAGHLGAHRGLTTDYDVITLGSAGTPRWIIISVKNMTAGQSRWVFSLGTHTTGRYGTYKRLFIYDQLSGRYLLYAMPDKNGRRPDPATLPLDGAGVPFELAPGTQAMLVVYIVPEAGAPATFSPRIMTEQAFWRAQHRLTSPSSLIRMTLVAAAGYFLGLLILRRNPVALPYLLFLLAQGAAFEVQNKAPYSDFPFASETTLLLQALVAFFGLFLSKFFLGIRGSQSREGILLYLLMIAGFALCGFALFAVPETNILRPIILAAVPAIGFSVLCLLCLAQASIGTPAAGLFGLGWLVLLIGYVIGELAVTGILGPGTMTVNAYWTASLVQCGVLVAASFLKSWIAEQGTEEAKEAAEEEADALSRIRQAKDVSENARLLKVIEHERSILQELRDREIQQNEDMHRAKDEADLANRAKSAFLAVISHEIRTPMSGIMGMVRLLLDTTLSREQADYARTIQDSGNAMLALLNDILDFEKIESGKMDLEIIDFDLSRLINDIITLMSGHAGQKGINIRADIAPDVPRFVRGDPVRLRQVLLNLTGNAIKFTSAGDVVLSLRRTNDGGPRKDDGKDSWLRLYFGVRDSGIGISREAQKNLFNPFSQADNSISRKYGGTGLGLAICQRLIEAMGGKIEIDSIEGEGSTFFYTIMMEEGRADRAGTQDHAPKPGARAAKSLNILCVDDNDVNQKLMKEFVSRQGHTPTLAGSGEQALDLMKAGKFDLVLMDVQLPGISGMGATKAIRSLPDREKAATPVIALTGNVRDEDIRQCYAANMNGHLAKPLEPDKLKAQIDKVIAGTLDNPVALGDADAATRATPEVRIQDNQSFDAPSLSFAEDQSSSYGSMSPLQAYALREEREKPHGFTSRELDEDSFAEAMAMPGEEMPEHSAASAAGVPAFDHTLLDGLKATMKPSELKDMVDSLSMKNDEIIAALQDAVQRGDMGAITARAHELKGMCGNFGLKELSAMGAAIEKAARDNAPGGLSEIISSLPDAHARAKAALGQWMDA